MKQRLKIALGIVFVVILVGYTFFTFYGYWRGPRIDTHFPLDGYGTTSPHLTVSGKANNINFITLNDRQIYVDDTGAFNEIIILQNGANTIEISGKDRYNREVTKLIRVVRINP